MTSPAPSRLLLKQANTRLTAALSPAPLLGVLLASALGLSGCGESAAAPVAASPATPAARVGVSGEGTAVRSLAVRTAQVQQRDLRQELSYVGTVRARREVKVAARVGGTLLAQSVEEGARVARGQLLAEIGAPELDAKAQTVRAELDRARALEAQACRVARTDRQLAVSGALSQARVDASAAQCKGAQEAVRAVLGRQRELGISVDRRQVRAPADGQVLRWLTETGETVGPGRPLALLAVGALELEIQLTDSDVLRGVRPGGAVQLHHTGPDGSPRLVEAGVLRVAPMAAGPLRHVAVRTSLPEPLDSAAPGSGIDARLLLAERKGASCVPVGAVARGPGDEAAVFVARPDPGAGRDARARRHPVTVGMRSGGWVAIDPPLPPGTLVVTSGLSALVDGAPLFAVSEPNPTDVEVPR